MIFQIVILFIIHKSFFKKKNKTSQLRESRKENELLLIEMNKMKQNRFVLDTPQFNHFNDNNLDFNVSFFFLFLFFEANKNKTLI